MKKIKPNQERRPHRNFELRQSFAEELDTISCVSMREIPTRKLRERKNEQKNWRRQIDEEDDDS